MAEETLAKNLDITFDNTDKEAVLSARDIIVEFTVRDRVLTAIRNVSLDLYDGETLAIVGESGSGKSVFTKTFTGMLEKNGNIPQGKIIFEGRNLLENTSDKDWEEIRGKKIATIFQDPMTSLNPIRTIGSQITEVIVKHQGVDLIEARKIAVDLMKRVGINNAENRFDEYPFMYSGGMRQRVVIAIALACNPDILICDEPTTALDVTIQAKILEVIKKLQVERNISVIFITHDLGVVAKVADYVDVMYAGRIIEKGSIDEIFYDPRHPYTWGLLASMPDTETNSDRLYAIPGTPPDLLKPITYDAFAPRNEYALAIDYKAEPPMFNVGGQHRVASWLCDERSPRAEMPTILKDRIERMREESEKYGS